MPLARVFFAFVAAAAVVSASADEGRIPLFEPTTITESGHYVVTNDFESTSGPAIRIEALDVTIDLGGHVVSGDVVTAPTAGEHHLWLKNGRIVGALSKSYTAGARSTGSGPLSAVDPMVVRLTDVTGLAGGINFDPCVGFEMRNARIDGGVILRGNVGALHAQILDSTVLGSVAIGDLTDSVIRGNAVRSDLTLETGDLGSEDNTIEGNVVRGHIKLVVTGAPGSIRNVVRSNQAGGIDVDSDENHIVANSIRKGSITVNGSKNLIEGNAVQGPVVGLVLNGDGNVYKNNILHNNAGGSVQVNGTGNFNAGGNTN
jgi:riboflavin synthase alpha subunit